MRTILNFIFMTVYLILIGYGASEVVAGILNPDANSIQPVLAIGLIIAGLVGVVDVVRDFGEYA